jgi:hypothetical protein
MPGLIPDLPVAMHPEHRQILGALLRTVGGRIILDAHDLTFPSNSEILVYEEQDPYRLIIELKED